MASTQPKLSTSTCQTLFQRSIAETRDASKDRRQDIFIKACAKKCDTIDDKNCAALQSMYDYKCIGKEKTIPTGENARATALAGVKFKASCNTFLGCTKLEDCVDAYQIMTEIIPPPTKSEQNGKEVFCKSTFIDAMDLQTECKSVTCTERDCAQHPAINDLLKKYQEFRTLKDPKYCEINFPQQVNCDAQLQSCNTYETCTQEDKLLKRQTKKAYCKDQFPLSVHYQQQCEKELLPCTHSECEQFTIPQYTTFEQLYRKVRPVLPLGVTCDTLKDCGKLETDVANQQRTNFCTSNFPNDVNSCVNNLEPCFDQQGCVNQASQIGLGKSVSNEQYCENRFKDDLVLQERCKQSKCSADFLSPECLTLVENYKKFKIWQDPLFCNIFQSSPQNLAFCAKMQQTKCDNYDACEQSIGSLQIPMVHQPFSAPILLTIDKHQEQDIVRLLKPLRDDLNSPGEGVLADVLKSLIDVVSNEPDPVTAYEAATCAKHVNNAINVADTLKLKLEDQSIYPLLSDRLNKLVVHYQKLSEMYQRLAIADCISAKDKPCMNETQTECGSDCKIVTAEVKRYEKSVEDAKLSPSQLLQRETDALRGNIKQEAEEEEEEEKEAPQVETTTVQRKQQCKGDCALFETILDKIDSVYTALDSKPTAKNQQDTIVTIEQYLVLRRQIDDVLIKTKVAGSGINLTPAAIEYLIIFKGDPTTRTKGKLAVAVDALVALLVKKCNKDQGCLEQVIDLCDRTWNISCPVATAALPQKDIMSTVFSQLQSAKPMTAKPDPTENVDDTNLMAWCEALKVQLAGFDDKAIEEAEHPSVAIKDDTHCDDWSSKKQLERQAFII